MRIKYVILGLAALLTMLVTFGVFGLQFYLREQSIMTSQQKEEGNEIKEKETTIFIEKIDDLTLKGQTLTDGAPFVKELKGMKAQNKGGHKMPLSTLKAGQIVTVQGHTITSSPLVHTVKNVSGLEVDLEKMTVNAGNVRYRLADNHLVVDAMGNRLSLTELSPYDIVSLTIYDNKVWSMIQEKASARLILKDVPKNTGQIAIDNSRLIQLKDIKGGIPITPGQHKIVVKMPQYKPLSIHIIVEDGEDYVLSLSDAKLAYTTIIPQLNVSDYKLTVAGKTYTAKDEIRLVQGTYTVTLQADGYHSWRGKIELSKDVYLLRVNLAQLKEDEEDNDLDNLEIEDDEETVDFLSEDDETHTQTETAESSTPSTASTANSSNTTPTSNTQSETTTTDTSNTQSETTTTDTSNTQSETDTIDVSPSTSSGVRTITLSTSPTGASIYNGDTLIGTAPFTTELKDGTHDFVLQKEGYQPYTAKVTLNSTDEGGIYLYKLKKTE